VRVMKMSKNVSLSELVLLVAALVSCAGTEGVAGQGALQELVSPQQTSIADLKILWQSELPLERGETLGQLFNIGNRVYALSSRNYMVCIDGETGNVIFGKTIGGTGLPVVGLELYKDELFSVAAAKLVEINPQTGAEIGVKRLGFDVSCPAARNNSYFYIAGADHRIRTMRANDKVEVFGVAAENNSKITSVIADENFVVFATDAGNLISIKPDSPRKLWQFDAAGGIAEPIVKDANSLFFASKDTSVYKLDVLTGKFQWKYQAGAVLGKGPRAAKKAVYQFTGKGLAAIDKQNGKLLWQSEQAVDLLSETAGRTYVITKAGELIVVDNKGKQVCSIKFTDAPRWAVNTADSKIYIADKTGRIACLKPIEY